MDEPDIVDEFDQSDLVTGDGGGDSDGRAQKADGPAGRNDADVVETGVVAWLVKYSPSRWHRSGG